MSLLVLSGQDVVQVTATFSPNELVALMASVFSRLSSPSSATNANSSIIQPHRTVVPTTHHTALFMPSRVGGAGTTMKVVSVPAPDAPTDVKARGLPASTLVMDERTGAVRAVVNARLLTALRNAAGSLLSTRLLSSTTTPQNIVAIGAGAQIQAHLSLFLSAYPSIETCSIFNRTQNPRLENLRLKLGRAFPGVQVYAGRLVPENVGDAGEQKPGSGSGLKWAIGCADIIITATSSTAPLFPSEWVRPGTHLCLVGSYKPEMHEIDTALVRRAGKVVVDQASACLAEAGELIAAGRTESDLVELGSLYDYQDAKGTWTPRTTTVDAVRTSGEVTIFKSVGVGVQDVAIACAVVDRAVREGFGKTIEGYDDEPVNT